MNHNKEPSPSPGSLLLTRRTVVAGMLTAMAAPMALTRALGARTGPADPEPSRVGVRPLYREFHTSTETPFGTVVAGGFRYGALSSVQIFDGRFWQDLPPLLVPRYHHTAVAYGTGVLVMGGLSSLGEPISHAEAFDGNQWVAVTPLNLPRSHHAAVVYDGKPMVIGGKYRGILASVEAFDGDRWAHYPGINIPRYGLRATVENGAPTIRGGTYLAPVTTVETFDGVRWRAATAHGAAGA